MLKANNLTKSYGNLEVLRGIDMHVNEAEIVSITGKSGSGKSTLLHILGTLDKPDSGEVFIQDAAVFELSKKQIARFRNDKIGFVFQFHHLLPEFTAEENVCIPAFIKGVNDQKARDKAQKLLDYLGLKDRFDHKPSQLSGGEAQRVAVARALINDPALVLADEPSGNLDMQNSTELHNLFLRLRKDLNQTFIIVTHNPELAKMSDRTIVLRDGQFQTDLTN